GPIAFVEEGDRITIDIRHKTIELVVAEGVLTQRQHNWQPPAPRITSGYVARYARLVTSGSTGAVLREDGCNHLQAD
ncbi:MAG: dihydroxy-acid dehydratase, partial [Desulfurivibrionaceae bacterium]